MCLALLHRIINTWMDHAWQMPGQAIGEGPQESLSTRSSPLEAGW